jgi:hypothetical protein
MGGSENGDKPSRPRIRVQHVVESFGTVRAVNDHRKDPEEGIMKIDFRHDVDQVLEDARSQQKPVLLDFSAAPM